MKNELEKIMKSKSLITLISAAALLVAGTTHAEGNFKNNAHHQNFISKRPYQQVVTNSDQKKDQQWEGATLISDQASDDVVAGSRHTLRLNMLSKRPY
jgi:hypothetical protein